MFLAHLKEWRSRVINQHFHRALIPSKKSTLALTLLAPSHWSLLQTPHSSASLAGCCASYWPTSLFPKIHYLSHELQVPRAAEGLEMKHSTGSLWQHEQPTVCSVLSYFCENNRRMMSSEPSFPSNAIIKWPKDKIHTYKKYWQNLQPMQHIHKEFWYFLGLFLSQNWEIYKIFIFSTP